MSKPVINIVWFKRDLRLQDHFPLMQAMDAGLPVLLIYFFEPSVMQYADSDKRHHRFAEQSITAINRTLKPYDHKIYAVHSEVIAAFEKLNNHYTIHSIFSHQETGNLVTYKRDIAVAEYCAKQNILWNEAPANGVIRRLSSRKEFTKRWLETMNADVYTPAFSKASAVNLKQDVLTLWEHEHDKHHLFQPGGFVNAEKYLHSFLYDRKSNYNKYISKPEQSRTSCSRISPYLAWGNLSMKQVYQAALKAITDTGDKRNLRSFINRLHWHCHFIQKFESECRMEFENLNKGFDTIRTQINPQLVTAWENGTTGYPLVDACMRCVKQTGYLNFRMRSMVVSFLTHHLWQPWQAGVHFLARNFLDYEPGIHYAQFQMQAGTMGVNTIRIYNPVKQSKDHDPEGVFIKRWIPELEGVPKEHIHTPWQMTTAEQLMYKVELGKQYPLPVVDIQETGKYARAELWRIKASAAVKKENKRILKIHTKRKTEKEQTLQLNFDESN